MVVKFTITPELIVGIVSAISAFLAWRVAQKTLVKQSEPILSFSLFTKESWLYLKVKNVGKSPASNINLKLLEYRNNGKENIHLSDILNSCDLYLNPEEEVVECVGMNAASLATHTYPSIYLDVEYINAFTKKENKDKRRWVFHTSPPENTEFMMKFQQEIDYTKGTCYALTRIANYLEGKWKSPEKLSDSAPNGSLYEDMLMVKNNQKNSRPKTPEEWDLFLKKDSQITNNT